MEQPSDERCQHARRLHNNDLHGSTLPFCGRLHAAVIFSLCKSPAIGASLCLFQKTSMYALANVDGTFYFPTVSGLQSLWITAAGSEKLPV